MIAQFLLNVAILVSLSVVSALFFEALHKKRLLHVLTQGLLYGIIAIFAMMHPVRLGEGFIFDARTVVVSLCAWFFGPLAAILSTAIAVMYRWSLGGGGAITGILTLVTSAAVGLIFFYQKPLATRLPKSLQLLVFGFGVNILVLGIIWLTLPNVYLFKIAPIILFVYPLATMVCGKILVTQYRLLETLHALNLQNEHTRLITDSMREVLWILEFPSLTFSYISPSNLHHTGYTPEEAMELTLEETLSPASFLEVQSWLERDLAALADPKASDSPKTRIVQERCKDGSFIWSEISITLLSDTNGTPTRMIGVSRDVSKRLEQEKALQESEQRYRALSEDLQESLAEKSALLKEVHHRVKNNLQVITSLLRLEASGLKDPASREVILDMQRRVRSMSLLHETVYQSNSLAHVEMEAYFTKLTRQILNTMTGTHAGVYPQLDLAHIELNIEQAIPCGLLLNELLSNACKHAFDADTPGKIHVRLQPKNETHIILEVSDNGKGLPPDFQTRRKHSLGLQLIDDLTRQLNGCLDIQSNDKTSFRITFPRSNASRNTTETSLQ